LRIVLNINDIPSNYISLVFSAEGFSALPTATLSAPVFFINTTPKNDLSTWGARETKLREKKPSPVLNQRRESQVVYSYECLQGLTGLFSIKSSISQ